LVELTPNNPEAWYMYGAQVFHSGALAGVTAPEEQSMTLLERALTLDRDYIPAQLLIAHLATRKSPPDSLDPAVAVVDSSNPFASYLRWRHALATDDSTAQRHIRGNLRGAGPANLRMLALASQFDGMSLADGVLALGALQSRVRSIPDQVDLILGQHSLAVLQGRPQAALEATRRLAAIQPGAHGYLRLQVLDALYGEGDTIIAAAAARRLETLTSGETASVAITSEMRLSNVCTAAQWRLSGGDTTGARAAVQALRVAGYTGGRPATALNSAAMLCSDLLDVWIAVLTGSGDARARLERIDSVVLTPEVGGDVTTYAPLLIGRLYETMGEPSGALRAVRKRAYMSGWPRYLATAWREEGRLAELNGDRIGAGDAYRRYLDLRDAPEPAVMPQREQVRSALKAVSTEAPL
jgi:hypothetical protein